MPAWMIGLATLVVYLIVVLYIGYRSWRISEDTIEDYAVARSTFGVLVLTLTFAASYHSAYAFTGIVGFAYNTGIGFWVNGLWLVPPALLFWLWGRRLWILGRKNGYLSLAEYLGEFYQSPTVAVLVAAVHFIFIAPYVGIQLTGAGYIFDTITEGRIPFEAGAVAMLLVVIAYTWLGGIRGVAWTDTFQGILMFIGILVGSYLVLRNVGGSVSAVFVEAAQKYPEYFSLPGPKGIAKPWFWVSLWTVMCLGMTCSPHIIIRMFTARSLRILKWSSILGGAYLTLIYLFTPGIGAVGHLLYPGTANPDQIMVDLLWGYTPVVFGAVLLAGGFAAAMSTADSQVHAVSTTLAVDVYKNRLNRAASSRQVVSVNRWLVVVISLLGLVIAITKPAFLIGLLGMSLGGIAQLTPALVGALYWRRASTAGAIASIVGGITTNALIQFVWRDPLGVGMHAGFYGLIVGSLAFVLVSLASSAVPDESIRKNQRIVAEVTEAAVARLGGH